MYGLIAAIILSVCAFALVRVLYVDWRNERGNRRKQEYRNVDQFTEERRARLARLNQPAAKGFKR